MFVRKAAVGVIAIAALAALPVIAGATDSAFEELNNPTVMARAMWCADAVAHGGKYNAGPAEWPHLPQVKQLTGEEREACDPLIRKLRASWEESDRRKAAEKATRDAEEAERQRRAAMPHNDPGAISLCRPPHKMTERDGCQ